MKTNKKTRQIVAEIISCCKHNGAIDETAVSKFVTLISKSPDLLGLELLTELERQLKLEERQDTLFVESAYSLTEEELEKIKASFEKTEAKSLSVNFSINKNLLAGLRVRLGDFVWEKSVISNLENLKGTLSYE